MSRLWSLLAAVLVMSLTTYGGPLAQEQPAVGLEEVFGREVQAAGQAWQFSGVDLPAGYVATVTASGTWEVNPNWNQKVGAAGNPQYHAGENYVKERANEGCLLVRVGDTVRAFAKDDEVVEITTPGKIYFCRNDEPTEGGAAKAKDYLAALPLAAKDGGGQGFLDNSGTLKVRIVVKKAAKQ